jgi:hypothetical protein
VVLQVWYDGVQHRGATVNGYGAERLKGGYLREIAETERDGWAAR